MKRFLPYYSLLRAVIWPFIAAILFGVGYGIASGFGLPFMINTVLPALFPTETGQLARLVIVSNEKYTWLPNIIVPAHHVLLVAVILLPATFTLRGVCQFCNVYLLNYAGIRVLETVRTRVFSRLQTLHLDFFRKHKSGDLISRVSGDTAHMKSVIVDTTNDILIQPFTFIGALCYIVWTALQKPDTLYFILSLLALPLVVLPIRMIGRKLRRKSHSMLAQAGNLNAILTESIQSPREIRAYNLETRETTRFRDEVRKFFRQQMKVVKYDKMLSPIIEIISATAISLAIYQLHGTAITQSEAASLIAALYFAYEPVKRLGGISNRVKQGEAALTRIEEILFAPIEVAEPAAPRPIPAGRGEVVFEHVTFGYDAGAPVLRDINITIRTGETIALVGPSGAGKTTFINLIPRFYDVAAGRILINGIDIRDASLAGLRHRIALVSQQPILFNDTIYHNILLGKLDATRAEVEEAARRAHALDFIHALEHGWDTIVGERGERLSGGQRQRIAIARAFLRDAPILILDEATSALDSESEAKVQHALDELAQGKTTFIIAHRFSTIRNAGTIL
ncbi:MAG: ABC transporter ATP-binding protein/permease, partial [Opitutaceae bacterium]|nr:ABC transporter ATP-binding protein/permease [Opitutaceae bacterium]